MKRYLLIMALMALFSCSEDDSPTSTKNISDQSLIYGTWRVESYRAQSTGGADVMVFDCNVEDLDQSFTIDKWFLQASSHTFSQNQYSSVNECTGIDALGGVVYNYDGGAGKTKIADDNTQTGGVYTVTSISSDRLTFRSVNDVYINLVRI